VGKNGSKKGSMGTKPDCYSGLDYSGCGWFLRSDLGIGVFLVFFFFFSFLAQASTREDQLLLLAKHYYQNQNYPKAIKIYNEFLKKYPNSAHRAEVLLRLGETYEIIGDISRADNTFEKIIIEYPETDISAKAYLKKAH